MQTFATVRHFRGITLTLATANTKYNLGTLVAVVDATAPPNYNEVVISAADGNAGKVRVGDVSLSTTRCGYTLGAGDSRTYTIRAAGVDIQDIYLMPDTDAQGVNVELIGF